MATPRRNTVVVLTYGDLEDIVAKIEAGFEAINERLDGVENAVNNRLRIDQAKVIATDALRAVVTRPPATKGRR